MVQEIETGAFFLYIIPLLWGEKILSLVPVFPLCKVRLLKVKN